MSYVNKIKKNEKIYDIHDKRIDDAQSGTIADVFGLDSEGNLVKGSAGGGTKLYKHAITFTNALGYVHNFYIISVSNQSIANLEDIYNAYYMNSAGITATFIEDTSGGIAQPVSKVVFDENAMEMTFDCAVVSLSFAITENDTLSDTISAL